MLPFRLVRNSLLLPIFWLVGGLFCRLEAALPPGFQNQEVTAGLSQPTTMEFAPDGRLFICQQNGVIRVLKNGVLLAQPFAALAVDGTYERGLLGMTFDPAFATNGYLYVYYTAPTPQSHNRVSRLEASGDVMTPGSETVLFELPFIENAIWHMGGAIHIGPLDGKLYVSVGDHTYYAISQSLTSLFGKILRLNRDGSVPEDNPFLAQTTGAQRAIWAKGLRNPYTTAFQPGTGRFFINDVGQTAWEEINDGQAGYDYGWPVAEGPAGANGFTRPFFYYPHSETDCAITAGDFYNPPAANFPSQYVGKYFYADYCGGWIRYIDPNSPSPAANGFATGLERVTALRTGPDGSLYYISYNFQAVYRISYNSAPVIFSQPQSQKIAENTSATFTVEASGASPFTYQWRRNGTAITNATASSYTLANAQLADHNAQFTVTVQNSVGSVTSPAALLTVVTGSAPVPLISAPASGSTYRAGDTISYGGSATDAEDGVLATAELSWKVDFHHNTHSHPFLPPATGVSGGTFPIPTDFHSTSTWYRIYLTATDSSGLSTTTFREIFPVLTTFSLATVPAGIALSTDGQPQATPATVSIIENSKVDLSAPREVRLSPDLYLFSQWSDGGALTHNVTVGTPPPTFTASYQKVFETELSSLVWKPESTNGYGPIERNMSNGEAGAGDGRVLTLNGVQFQTGLGVHAASNIIYDLAGLGFTRFLAKIGLDDEVAAEGSVVFQVWLDEVKRYQSGLLTGTSPIVEVDLDLTGARVMRLVVTTGDGSDRADHADWADARLFRPASSYNAWKLTKFTPAELLDAALSGDLADPDADGAATVAEYAFALNPWQSDFAGKLTPGRMDDHATLAFDRRLGDSGLLYVPEYSDTLAQWSSTPTLFQQLSAVDLQNGMERVTISTTATGDRQFIRLRLVAP